MQTHSKIGPQQPPLYAPIPQACALLGLGRTKVYDLAGRGLIRIVKVGSRSLVDIDQALEWMATLPTAAIAPQNPKAGA
jgi:excisionase family DNA binding protein